MCRCLELNVKGQMCFLFWLPAIHHMGTSIFHLGRPYYMIWSCLAVTFGSVPGLLFPIFSVKSMWLGLLCPRCIHLDSFPQETWGPGVVLSETMLRVPIMSTDPSFLCCNLPLMENTVCQIIIFFCWSCPLKLYLESFRVWIWISWLGKFCHET